MSREPGNCTVASGGAKNLFLGVWESNERAIALYESRGFEKVGGYKFKVGDTLDDEFIMRLRLA